MRSTNPRPAAFTGIALALPFLLLFTLLVLHFEPNLGPLQLLLTGRVDEPHVGGSLIVLGAWLLAVVAFAPNAAPIVRAVRAGTGWTAHPLNLVVTVAAFAAVLLFGGAIVVDQFPCWIGAPNCDLRGPSVLWRRPIVSTALEHTGSGTYATAVARHSCMNIRTDLSNIHGILSSMIPRPAHLDRLATAVRRSPVTALLGPRQVGKTTLARLFAADRASTRFDLESEPDRRRLANPELVLGTLTGLVIIDEIQVLPELFAVLRVLVDRPDNAARFLILGSASPDIVRHVSESLAGRIEFVELGGFDLAETGVDAWRRLWLRGGFPRSFLAESDDDSAAWREGFLRTFLERDIQQLGLSVPAPAMRRFWTMLAHFHGQTWNASELGRSLGVSDKQVRTYLDVLTGTFMVRQLQPWYENIAKRQVKAPKVYLRDSGILHALLGLPDEPALLGHPRVGASWEGFALEHVLSTVRPNEAYFWATYQGAELDLLFTHRGRRYGVEMKFSEAPRLSRSMRVAVTDLRLEHLWVVHPGPHRFAMNEHVTAWPIHDLPALAGEIA